MLIPLFPLLPFSVLFVPLILLFYHSPSSYISISIRHSAPFLQLTYLFPFSSSLPQSLSLSISIYLYIYNNILLGEWDGEWNKELIACAFVKATDVAQAARNNNKDSLYLSQSFFLSFRRWCRGYHYGCCSVPAQESISHSIFYDTLRSWWIQLVSSNSLNYSLSPCLASHLPFFLCLSLSLSLSLPLSLFPSLCVSDFLSSSLPLYFSLRDFLSSFLSFSHQLISFTATLMLHAHIHTHEPFSLINSWYYFLSVSYLFDCCSVSHSAMHHLSSFTIFSSSSLHSFSTFLSSPPLFFFYSIFFFNFLGLCNKQL